MVLLIFLAVSLSSAVELPLLELILLHNQTTDLDFGRWSCFYHIKEGNQEMR